MEDVEELLPVEERSEMMVADVNEVKLKTGTKELLETFDFSTTPLGDVS